MYAVYSTVRMKIFFSKSFSYSWRQINGIHELLQPWAEEDSFTVSFCKPSNFDNFFLIDIFSPAFICAAVQAFSRVLKLTRLTTCLLNRKQVGTVWASWAFEFCFLCFHFSSSSVWVKFLDSTVSWAHFEIYRATWSWFVYLQRE